MVEYNYELLLFFAIRFAILFIAWALSLKFIRANEFSNAHIDWARIKIVPNDVHDSTEWMCAAMIALGMVIACNCYAADTSGITNVADASGEIFLKNAMFVAQVGLAFSYLIFYKDTVKRTQQACVERNQRRLYDYIEAVTFDRKYNHIIIE